MNNWHPHSWQKKPVAQHVDYPDPQACTAVLKQLSQLPPLVTSWEVETLKSHLADAAEGRRFLVQGGDCAESFEDCRPDRIAGKLKILLKMSIVMLYGSKKPVVRVGRFAGQYAKPRSSPSETRDGVTLPSYRGQLVNRRGFSLEERTPDPQLMLRAYEHSAMTLNFIRGLIDGGFADLRHPELWDLAFVSHAKMSSQYQRIVGAVGEAISFLEAVAGRSMGELSRVEFFTSHEGLLLSYEAAQTRKVPRRSGWYNLHTHFPWIGDRTRSLEGAHVEFFRGIANPIGVKIGPDCTAEELLALAGVLNPDNEPGRLTFIHRFGARRIETHLPELIEAIQRERKNVLWVCDPMHGNTIQTRSGLKTRDFEDILAELTRAFEIHARIGSNLGGVHFELTGDDVTECIGGARGLVEADLARAYLTDVDPRLNYEQSLEMALLIARYMGRKRESPGRR